MRKQNKTNSEETNIRIRLRDDTDVKIMRQGFKVTVINTLRTVTKKVDSIQECFGWAHQLTGHS